MGPLDTDRPWRTNDIVGVHRFLQRLWRAIIDETTGKIRVSDQPLDHDSLQRLHRTIMVVRKDNLEKNRDAIVRTVAGMIEAARFMQDPKNADAVAEAAAVTGHDKEVNKLALAEFLKIDFWAAKDDGMPKAKIEAVAALMKKIGSIKPDKEPVSYDKFVDPSVWKDANAMVK